MKEGPNKDRQFYNCSLRSCNFFEWVDGIGNKPSNNTYVSQTNTEKKGGFACFKCNQEGHYANNCPNANKSKSVPTAATSSSSSGPSKVLLLLLYTPKLITTTIS